MEKKREKNLAKLIILNKTTNSLHREVSLRYVYGEGMFYFSCFGPCFC